MHRSGFINIIGNPNVGKSTLMNALVGRELSIITHKAQTTRPRILGSINGEDFQIVLSDTPGVIKPAYEMQTSMMNIVKEALVDADVLLYMVTAEEKELKDELSQLAINEYGGIEIDEGPWQEIVNPNNGKKIVIKDVICDAFLQQIILRPAEYDVIATMNLNGDYISDALAAQVGGIGIAPGANINYDTGIAIFEATHGTAPKYTGQDKVNPGSLILSAEMMLRHMGWVEAADLIIKGMEGAISAGTVTYDFERLMEGATLLSCSGFGDALISHM